MAVKALPSLMRVAMHVPAVRQAILPVGTRAFAIGRIATWRGSQQLTQELRRAEAAANERRTSSTAQQRYLELLLNAGMAQEVIRRVESNLFAIDESVAAAYSAAIAQAHNLPARDRAAVCAAVHGAWRATSDAGHGTVASGALRTAAVAALRQLQHAASQDLPAAVNSLPDMPGEAPVATAAAPPAGAALGSREHPVAVEVLAVQTRTNPLLFILQRVATLLVFFWLYMMFVKLISRGGADPAGAGGPLAGLLDDGGTSAGEVKEVPTTRFSDVKGCDEAKEELQDVVAFLREPEKYRRLGAKVPRGVLLTGPPGTGKTLLARAVAGEAGCAFYSKSASEFEEMLVGLGARRVRALFAQARKHAPAIVFIDEIDAMGGKRTATIGMGHERQTLNQLLACMDGFTKNENVIVIAATNMAELLDPALVRPGRFDTTVNVPVPDVRGREEILRLYLGKVVADAGVDAGLLAKATPGFTGAQIEAMVNSAALMAANRGASRVEMADFEEARDKVIMGPARKSKVQRAETLRMTAYHEGGHTLTALLTPGAEPVHKVTILPRGQTGGATWSLPSDEDYKTKQGLTARIDVAMGGRAAEELLNGPEQVTTGAGSDMAQATALARAMVLKFAMSRVGLSALESHDDLSPERKAQVDAEVETILQESYARVKGLLVAHRRQLDALAAALLEHETLSAEQCADVLAGKQLPPPLPRVHVRKQEEEQQQHQDAKRHKDDSRDMHRLFPLRHLPPLLRGGQRPAAPADHEKDALSPASATAAASDTASAQSVPTVPKLARPESSNTGWQWPLRTASASPVTSARQPSQPASTGSQAPRGASANAPAAHDKQHRGQNGTPAGVHSVPAAGAAAAPPPVDVAPPPVPFVPTPPGERRRTRWE